MNQGPPPLLRISPRPFSCSLDLLFRFVFDFSGLVSAASDLSDPSPLPKRPRRSGEQEKAEAMLNERKKLVEEQLQGVTSVLSSSNDGEVENIDSFIKKARKTWKEEASLSFALRGCVSLYSLPSPPPLSLALCLSPSKEGKASTNEATYAKSRFPSDLVEQGGDWFG